MIKQFFGYLTGEVLFKVITLILFYLFVNKFTKEEYALYGILLANITFFAMFIRFGQHAVLSRYYFDKEKDFNKILGVVVSIFVIVSVLFLTSTLLLYGYYKDYLSKIASPHQNIDFIIWMIISISILMFFHEITLTYSNVLKKTTAYNFIKIQQVVINIIVTVGLYYFMNVTLMNAFLLGLFFSYLLMSVFCIYYLFKNYTIGFSKSYFKEIFIFSVPLFLHNLSLLVMVHVNKFILNEYSTIEAVAGITFITNLAVIIESVIMIFNRMWMPHFYEFLNSGQNKESNYLMKKIFIIFSLLIVLFILLNNEIILILSKDKYIDLSMLSSIYITNVFFTFIYLYYSQFIFYLKKSYLLLRITVISAIINLAMNYIGIKYFALNGAVAVYILSQVIVSVFAFYGIKKEAVVYVPYQFFLKYFFIFTTAVFVLLTTFYYLNINYYLVLTIKISISLGILYQVYKSLVVINKFEKKIVREPINLNEL